jgi:20S proteasome alpha/beta subunit
MRLKTLPDLGAHASGPNDASDDDLDTLVLPIGHPLTSAAISEPALGSAEAKTSAEFASTALVTSGADISSAAAPTVTITTALVGSGVQASVASSTGFTMNLKFDPGMSASFESGIEQAASILAATLYDKITVNLSIHYSGSGTGASAGPDNSLFEPYSTVVNALKSHASSGDTVFNTLPAGSSLQGQTQVQVWNAEAKALGFMSPNDTTTDDGVGFFGTGIDPSALVGVALHELTHAMGRVPDGPTPDIFDLFRFTQPGARLFLQYIKGVSAPPAYFSVDGGSTRLADYGQNSDPSDFLNSGVQGSNDPFNEFYTPGFTLQSLTAVDKEQLDVLGFHVVPPDTTPPALVHESSLTVAVGATGIITSSLLQFDDNVSTHAQELYSVLTGPAHGTLLKANVATSSFTQADIDNGIITYRENGSVAASDSFTFRVTDAAGNQTTGQIFQFQLLNSDSTPPSLVDDSPLAVTVSGGTITPDLLRFDDNVSTHAQEFYSVITGPAHGTLLRAGLATSSFTQTDIDNGIIAYRGDGTAAATDSFTFRVTDAAGNTTTNQQFQFVLFQTIEANGSTVLVRLGSNYFLDPASGGPGIELKLSGSPFVAGQWGAWTPIAAEPISGGYEVAFKFGANTFTVWDTDANGNITVNALATTSGSSAALEALETSFQQDLNGDGITGPPPPPPTITIESKGQTDLAQGGGNFFLFAHGTTNGPELKYGGAPWATGQWGGWAPIGAEAISGGYEVAFKIGTDSYTVWDTDTNGNITSNVLATTSGSSTALQTLEISFQQDLNGDGTTGIPAGGSITIEAHGSTALVQTGNNYFLNPVAGGTGPELKLGGAPWATGTWGAWTPIGAEAIPGGYEVAFKIGADTYTVWDTDANGNITSNALGTTSGSNTALEALEVSFQQDLNGDGTTGIPGPGSITIESKGSTALVQTGSDYFFNPVAGGTGPEMKLSGAPWTTGTWGGWTPIGVEATASGYEVAFKFVGNTTVYTVWNTDFNGNITTNALATTSGSSTALESLETSFQQDLNGDGTIGIPSHTSPAAQVASAALAAPAAPSLGGGGDGFVFRPDLGSIGGGNAPPPAVSPAAGEMLTLTTAAAAVAHIDVVDVHDLGGVHDGAVQGALFDPFHGFIIH